MSDEVERFLEEQKIKSSALEHIQTSEQMLVVTLDENGDTNIQTSPMTYTLIGAVECWLTKMKQDIMEGDEDV